MYHVRQYASLSFVYVPALQVLKVWRHEFQVVYGGFFAWLRTHLSIDKDAFVWTFFGTQKVSNYLIYCREELN